MSVGDDPRTRRFDRVTFAAVGLAVLVIVAVIGFFVADDGHQGTAARATRTTAAPLDLATMGPDIAAHYEFAAAHGDVYTQIPCYCGCDRTLGHRNLKDCFVRADGTGWDAHASGCAVCTNESTAVRDSLAAGVAPADIRTQIIAQYGPPPKSFASTATAL